MILPFLILMVIPAPLEMNIGRREVGVGMVDAVVFHEGEHIVLRDASMPARSFISGDEAFFSPIYYRKPADMAVL